MTTQTLKQHHWDLEVDPNLFSLLSNEAAQFTIPVSFIVLQLTGDDNNKKKNRAKQELSESPRKGNWCAKIDLELPSLVQHWDSKMVLEDL
ncbi:hypothetical protein VNO80_02257 [Phaseolus coccineus]|uniref:Uncharacterized protein n=1 Tax=Phaseolus coccineus TaxID=3886 RepID=A0AAN9NQX9_PHACN